MFESLIYTVSNANRRLPMARGFIDGKASSSLRAQGLKIKFYDLGKVDIGQQGLLWLAQLIVALNLALVRFRL